MKIKSLAVFIIITLIFITIPKNNLYSEVDFMLYKKDTLLAGILSFYIAGLGQIYSGDTYKGVFFFVGENLLLFSAIFVIADLKFYSTPNIGINISLKVTDNIDSTRIYASVGLGIAFLALHIYNIIDAINTAKDFNQKLFESQLSENYYFDLKNDYGNTYLTFNYKF